MTLGDIGVNENVTWMGTTIQFLDDTGATMTTDEYEDLGEVPLTFTYVKTSDGAETEGWYLADDYGFAHLQNSRIVPFGKGLLVDVSDADSALVYAGKVASDDTEVTLEYNFNFTGNCSPKDITYADIVPNENVTWMGTTFQLLDDTGATMTTDEYEDLGEVPLTFTYVKTSDGAETEGWYLADDYGFAHLQNDRVLEAGAGILVDVSDAEASLTFPSAL